MQGQYYMIHMYQLDSSSVVFASPWSPSLLAIQPAHPPDLVASVISHLHVCSNIQHIIIMVDKDATQVGVNKHVYPPRWTFFRGQSGPAVFSLSFVINYVNKDVNID